MSRNIKKLLNKYLSMSAEHPEKEELTLILQKRIFSPALLAGSDFLSLDHPLKKEAIILSDAFEALTNGMINDEILKELSTIPPVSLMYQWKILIQAISAYYSGDLDSCLTLIGTIPEEMAPAAFKSLFQSLLIEESPSSPWYSLTRSIVEDNDELRDSLDLIRDSTESEEILLDTAGMIITYINRDDPGTAEKIMIWCLEHLQESDILSEKAITKVKKLFGDQQGYRLAALTSLSFDPDRSLIYWIHSLMAYLEQRNTDISFVTAYLNIIKDVAESVKLEFELTDEYIRLLASLITELSETLYHVYPQIQGEITLDEDPFQSIFQLAGIKKAPRTAGQTREIVQPLVQLELFAF
ncbi:hypothetical protein [Oceanispirochaeta sp.]|jgi:hypothetical protein|uniref:hypothetical protein n=1 Tax=Oceanispirochaeta sp. TaxID=2035350 RepID=UPI002610CC1B|nr:hypothetical protein [Oceanispirochaeta sp.]MDA3957689.1 hypothetical protein [Oceanispirochaeta sp.]